MAEPPARETWISKVGLVDEIHRSFSWVVAVAGGLVFYLAHWWGKSSRIKKLGTAILALIALQIVTGVGLYYLKLPPVYQVVHLVGIAVLIAFEFLLFLLVMHSHKDLPDL